jgi:hypothetical protein
MIKIDQLRTLYLIQISQAQYQIIVYRIVQQLHSAALGTMLSTNAMRACIINTFCSISPVHLLVAKYCHQLNTQRGWRAFARRERLGASVAAHLFSTTSCTPLVPVLAFSFICCNLLNTPDALTSTRLYELSSRFSWIFCFNSTKSSTLVILIWCKDRVPK